MPIKYYKLFDILNRRGISKTELRSIANITPATASKLFKGDGVSIETIERICESLDLQPGDFMEYVRSEEPPEPPKPKDKNKETKSEESKEESKNGGAANSLKMTESQIIQARYGVNIEEMELPEGYVKLHIPSEIGDGETIIATTVDATFAAGEEAKLRSYMSDSSKRVMAEIQLKALYNRLREESKENIKKLTA